MAHQLTAPREPGVQEFRSDRVLARTHRTPELPYARSFKKEILGQSTRTTTRKDEALHLLDVALSVELEAYGRRIRGRIAVGVGASLIASALLGWGLIPVSLQNQTFADALNSS